MCSPANSSSQRRTDPARPAADKSHDNTVGGCHCLCTGCGYGSHCRNRGSNCNVL